MDKTIYKNNKISNVILNVKYPKLSSEYYNKYPNNLIKLLEMEFPEVKKIPHNELQINYDGNTGDFKHINQEENYLWSFKKDNEKQFLFDDKSISLQYNGDVYTSIDMILSDLKLILKGLKKYNIEHTEFIGLRYINEIKEDINVDKLIKPKFKCIYKDDELIRSINKMEYSKENYILIFQYGQFNLNYPSENILNDFILDYDCQVRYLEKFENLEKIIKDMHNVIYDFFEESIDNGLRELMEIE